MIFDHVKKIYVGTSYINLMSKDVKKALHIYYGQKKRAGTKYSVNEFIYWWVLHPKRKSILLPNVARKDHSKPYSWDNIELQEQAENVKERNERCGNPTRTHKAVVAINLKTGKREKVFKTKQDAAIFYSVSEKTVYNHCESRTKMPFKFGPKSNCKVTFEWK